MSKKLTTYIPPQTCAEPLESPFGLCQASAGEYDTPGVVDDLTWTD